MSVMYPTKLRWLACGQLCGQQWPLLCGEHQNLDQMVSKVSTLNLNVGLEEDTHWSMAKKTHLGGGVVLLVVGQAGGNTSRGSTEADLSRDGEQAPRDQENTDRMPVFSPHCR